MQKLSLHLNTPVYIKEKYMSLIPPIVLDGVVYFVKERKFFEIIEIVNKLQNYLLTIREKGYEHTHPWLKSNGLLNHGFMESASDYFISDGYFEKNCEFITSNKSCFGEELAEKIIKNSFKHAVIYSHINENRKKFNTFVEQKLTLIEAELSNASQNRSQFWNNNIYKYLTDEFLNADEYLEYKLNKLNNTEIITENKIDTKDFSLYNVFNVKDLQNFYIRKENASNVECLKPNKHITMTMLDSDAGYIEKIMEYCQEFAKSKRDFEKKYLNDFSYSKIEKSLTENSYKEEGNCAVKTRKKVITSTSNPNNFINYIYMNADYSNMLIDSTENFEKLIFMLNLDNNLQEDISSMLNDQKISTLTKLAQNKGLIMPVGYGVLNY